jgi:hypothetical protein
VRTKEGNGRGDVLGANLCHHRAWLSAANMHQVMAHDHHHASPSRRITPSTACQFTGMREPRSLPSTTIVNFMATASPLAYSTMAAVVPWLESSCCTSATVFLVAMVAV